MFATRMERLRSVMPNGFEIVKDGRSVIFGERRIPVRQGILRFREGDGYNDTFALQWKKYREIQLDDVNSTGLTKERFLRETGWNLSDLRGELVLEAGSGAGRFTRLLAEAGAEVVTFDYSTAIDANRANNAAFWNVTFLQCDIFDMPFKEGAFDRVFCHGVLQHTPDPEQAFYRLNDKVKPGGSISIDIYLKDGKIRPWKSKYLWRPLTTRISPNRLLRFLEWFIPKWLPVDTVIKRTPVLGNYLGALIPCWNYFYTDLPPNRKVEWAILDTFDALSPTYDIPVTIAEARRWFENCRFRQFEVREGGNGIVGNGVKPRGQ
jgi:SAM-dependent methyltransferase